MPSAFERNVFCLVGMQLVCLGLVAQAPKPQVVLVELFTSEGCSSCPPADALLREINDTRSSSGQLIVGISEHVTYWNSLGWADPFSSSLFTERQNAYGSRLGLDGVYTPQIVVNGTEQLVGSDRVSLARAFKKEDEKPAQVAVHILATRLAGKELVVRFSTTTDASNGKADVIAVLADDMDRSSVLRGENSGRSLAHVAVARSLMRVASVQPAGEQEVRIAVPSSFQPGEAHHLILFAQAPSHGRVLGTDSAALSRVD